MIRTFLTDKDAIVKYESQSLTDEQKAYARLTDININIDGEAFGTFEIHQTREKLIESYPLERIHVNYIINKDLPIHNQLYVQAKKEIFTNWEDDIVTNISEVE